MAENDGLLKRIREEFQADDDEWRKIREEGRRDIRCVAGDAWDPDAKQKRKSSNRLTLTLDELGQYVNQVINDIRQNKRAIQVTANGNGSNDKQAQLRANRIRQIEYRSNAQEAYTTMFENTVQRSFGWLRIVAKRMHKSFDQELLIKAIPNPDMVTPGPHVMPDGSDIKRLWFHESRTHDEFRREFPKAKIRSFDSDVMGIPSIGPWVQANRIMVAEYWTKEDKERELVLIQTAEGPKSVFLEEMPARAQVLNRMAVDVPEVCQYFTNGLEILGKKTVWPGQDIPFVPCYGKVIFVTEGGQTERQILSMIRLARDPFMLYCYYRTCEAELVGMAPKFPYFAYEGALSEQDAEALQRSNDEPVAVIFVKPVIPEVTTGNGWTPYPHREAFEPAIQALEVGAEAARRAIQAAIGSSPLPTSAQRRNEKSGVALKQIEDTGQRGSFHFNDHYEAAIMRTGVILNDLLPHYHDTARDITLRKPDDSTQIVRVNDPTWENPETKQPELLTFEGGEYDVTISTGPKVDSEREAASDFADLLISSPQLAQIIGPEKMSEIVAIGIKLKNVGPLGDQMAEIISPSKDDQQPDPRQMQAELQQAQQALDLMSKELDAKNQLINTEGVKAELQIKLQKEKNLLALQIQDKKAALALRLAELDAQTKGVLTDMKHQADHEAQALGHEVEMMEAETQRQHEAGMSEMSQQQKLEQGDVAHRQQLEQGAAGHEQQLEQAQVQAALAPQPEAGA